MALIQGGYVRRLPSHKIKSTAVHGLWLIVPSFVCVGLANSIWMLYLGLFLFAVCKFYHRILVFCDFALNTLVNNLLQFFH